MMLAVSDVVWQAAIGAVVTIVLAYMQLKTKNAVVKTAADAAEQTEEVKKTIEEANVAQIQANVAQEIKLEEIHTLVNSGMGAQLRLHAETARSKANITQTKADIAIAEMAERMLKEHDQNQITVDNAAKKLRSIYGKEGA